MRLVREAGIPDGVVNLVLGGPETGDALVRHPLVQKVSFTGGPTTARRILATCAEFLKPAVLELGGKSANIVFPDADLDMAVAVNAFSVLGTLAGQGCAIAVAHARSRRHLRRGRRARRRRWSTACTVGDPFDPATVIGPVVSPPGAGTDPGDDRTSAGRRGEALRLAGVLPATFRTASSSNQPCSATSTRPPSSARSRCSVPCSR